MKHGSMKKVHECIHKVVHDVMTMPHELNVLARECEIEGYKVKRGAAGVVILELNNGEVHYVPAGSTIQRVIFAYEDDDEKEIARVRAERW